jgi:hypothetical protein
VYPDRIQMHLSQQIRVWHPKPKMTIKKGSLEELSKWCSLAALKSFKKVYEIERKKLYFFLTGKYLVKKP